MPGEKSDCNPLFCVISDSQERLESMVQPTCASPTLLGKSPPSPSKAPPEWVEAKKAASSRRRTTSNTRHRYTADQRLPKIFTSLSVGRSVTVLKAAFFFSSPDVTRLMKKTIARRSFFTSAAAPLENSWSTEGRAWVRAPCEMMHLLWCRTI